MQHMLSYLPNPFAADDKRRRPPTERAGRPLFGAADGPEGWLPDHQVEDILTSLCALAPPDSHGYREKLPAQRFERISVLVRCLDDRNGRRDRKRWQLRPRIYTILRSLQALHLMDEFIRDEIYDISLPFNLETLPSFVKGEKLRYHFLHNQQCVLTDARLLESRPDGGHSEHIHFETSADEHIIHTKLLGHGGYGSVDAVLSRLSLQFYARKRTHRGKDSEPNRQVQRYLIQEINLMKKFSHRHLTRVLGSYTDPKYIGYLMQPIAECNLEDFLVRRQLEVSDYRSLRQFFGCLAGAVNYLHHSQIRHRDLKPQNILVKSSQVYIADFGAALEWSSARRATTQDRNAPKTLFYMAPEIDDRAPRNAASDMWSLGIVFLEMLTVLKGIPLKKWRDHLAREARVAKREELPCKNIPALNNWFHHLQSDAYARELDNEPLMWIKSLLIAKPQHRLQAQALTKNISDSPYFIEHCCFDCRGDFEDPAYFYDPRRRTNATERPEGLLDSELAALIGAEDPVPNISSQRSQTIQDWIMSTHTQIPSFEIQESQTTVSFYERESQTEDESAQTFTQAKTSQTLMPGDYGESPSPPAKQKIHELGFVVEDDSESSGTSEYNTLPGSVEEEFDGEPFRIVHDGSSESDSDLSADIPVDTPQLRTDVAHLEQIPEDDREDDVVVALLGEDASEPFTNDMMRISESSSEDEESETNALVPLQSPITTIQPFLEGLETPPSEVSEDDCADNSVPLETLMPSMASLSSLALVPMNSVNEPLRSPRPEDIVPDLQVTHQGEIHVQSQESPQEASQEHPEEQSQHKLRKPAQGKPQEKSQVQSQLQSSKPSPKKSQKPPKGHSQSSPNEPWITQPKKPSKGSDKPAAQKRGKQLVQSALSSKNLEKLNGSAEIASARRSMILDGQTFSPVKYIEDAWNEMEAAESMATSVVSENFTRKFRGVHIKAFDREYAMLEHYCQDGKAAAVRALLEQGCNPGTVQKPRPKPLLLAIKGASARHNKCVRALIAHGCDVNARFRSKTPIHWAVERPGFKGHAKLMGMLLGAGAEMNQTDGDGDYPMLKVFSGNIDEPMKRHHIVALTLALHPKVPAPVDVNVRQPVSLNTALHLAIQRRASQVVAILIHFGADVNAKNSSGTTPLLMAANQWRGSLTSLASPNTSMPREQETTLVYLLDAPGINVNVQGGSLDRSALHMATAAGYVLGVELLLAHGADRQQKDKSGKDALQVLVSGKKLLKPDVFEEIHELLTAAS